MERILQIDVTLNVTCRPETGVPNVTLALACLAGTSPSFLDPSPGTMLLWMSRGCFEPLLVATGELGVVLESTLESGDGHPGGAECRGRRGECHPGVGARHPELHSDRDEAGIGEQLEHLPGDVALEAADDLASGLTLRGPADHVGLGRRISDEPGHGDPPQGVIGLSVA
jgi:hypothetical protein